MVGRLRWVGPLDLTDALDERPPVEALAVFGGPPADLITDLRRSDVRVAVVTGSFERGVETALERAGVVVDYVVANRLVLENCAVTGEVEGPLLDGQNKDPGTQVRDMIGKVPPDLLETLVLSRTGAPDSRVLQGPAYGEDTAAIQLEDAILVVNPDPISLAVGRIGTLGANVACNDIAASGATPEWLTSVIFLPGSGDALDEITRQLDAEARRLGVSIVGGHSEYAPVLEEPLLVLTCFGLTDRYVPTGGARPGDRILMTKSAGIEATAILATDFADRLGDSVPRSVLERGATFYDDVSVVADAAAVSEYAHAMHDPTEGGLVDGLLEMAFASGVTLEVDPDAIPVRGETARLCRAVDVDPLRTFGSGALLAAIPGDVTDDVSAELDEHGVANAIIGTVQETEAPSLVLGDETFTESVRDDMYALWE